MQFWGLIEVAKSFSNDRLLYLKFEIVNRWSASGVRNYRRVEAYHGELKRITDGGLSLDLIDVSGRSRRGRSRRAEAWCVNKACCLRTSEWVVVSTFWCFSSYSTVLYIPYMGYRLTPSDNIQYCSGGAPICSKFVARWSIIIIISSPDEWAMAIAVTKCKTSPIISLVGHDESIALRLETRWRQRWTDTNISWCFAGYLLWSSPSGTWKHGDVKKLYKANSPWMTRSTKSEQLQEDACILYYFCCRLLDIWPKKGISIFLIINMMFLV